MRKASTDIINKQYGCLLVLKMTNNYDAFGHVLYECLCMKCNCITYQTYSNITHKQHLTCHNCKLTFNNVGMNIFQKVYKFCTQFNKELFKNIISRSKIKNKHKQQLNEQLDLFLQDGDK